MNERIRELALQAMTATTNKFSADREWSADEWRDFYDTKFAELIVGECMSIAQEYDGSKLGGPGLIIAMRIEQHFGVEE
jgi:hypothetical protein